MSAQVATGKQHISIVVTGHIDAGKSTSTGHLLFKLGGISAREMEKLQAKADEQGKGSFAFAYYLDSCKEEQERGAEHERQSFRTGLKGTAIKTEPVHLESRSPRIA